MFSFMRMHIVRAASALPWDLLLLLLALAIVVPWRAARRVRKLLSSRALGSRHRLAIYASTIVFQWLAVAVVAWRSAARGVDAAQLGLVLHGALHTALVGVGLAVVFTGMQLAAFRGLAQLPSDKRGRVYEVAQSLMPRTASEAALFCLLVATVASCEEFLYRGFAFAAFAIILRSHAAAIFSSAVLFGVGHAYQGRRGVIMTSLLGIVFAWARVYTGSLLPSGFAHFVVDLLAGFAAPGGLWSTGRAGRGG
jgi:membrane protease YdiL (CAAX protease family)